MHGITPGRLLCTHDCELYVIKPEVKALGLGAFHKSAAPRTNDPQTGYRERTAICDCDWITLVPQSKPIPNGLPIYVSVA